MQTAQTRTQTAVVQVTVAAVIAVLVVVDNLTGPLLQLSIFYLAPIGLAAWRLPRRIAWLNAVLGGFGSYTADVLIGHRFDPDIAAVNAVFRSAMFGVVVELVHRLRSEFAQRAKVIAELQEALAQVRTLSGLLPMCAWCRKVRDDEGYWQELERYVQQHAGTMISHGICPECAAKLDADTNADTGAAP